MPTINVTPGSSMSVVAGTPVTIEIRASDRDSDPVSLHASLDNAPVSGKSSKSSGDRTPASFTVKGGVGTFKWTPGKRDVGEHPLALKATDGKSNAEQDMTITVKRAAWENEKPEMDVLPAAIIATPGVELRVDVSASDPDGDAVFFKADRLPKGAKLLSRGFDAATKQWHASLVYTPGADEVGRHYPVQITARDDFWGAYKQVSRQADIHVVDAPAAAPAESNVQRIAIIKARTNRVKHSLKVTGRVKLVKGEKDYSGYSVTIRNAADGSSLGSAPVNNKGFWRFWADSDSVCSVLAELGNKLDEKAVRNAPESCKQ